MAFKKYKGKRITARDKNWSKGTWYVWRRIGGKIIHKAIPEAQTKEQAEQAERKIIEDLFNKKYGNRDDTTTFKEFIDKNYSQYVEQNNTNIGAKKLYNRILAEHLGKLLLTDITPQDCRNVQSHLRRQMSDSSVNRVMSTLSKIFSLACEEGILDRNPMQYVKSLKEPPPRNRLLSKDEKERLWRELEKDSLLFRFVTLAVNLPLRRGQLLAIAPDAIDFQTGFLSVVASKGRAPRIIPVNTTAANTLRLMKTDGQLPFPIKDFRRRWKRILIRAGINKKDGKRGESFTFHDLRHVMATELTRKGVPGETIKKLYGHSDMSITQIYINPEMEDMAEAVKRLDDVQDTEGIQ